MGGVRKSVAFLALVLVVPFALRPKDEPKGESDETLIIVTPHNEAIRYEFGRAFRAYMKKKGRDVRVDWRNPGAGSEIVRYLASEYTASFERYWTEHEGHPFTPEIATAFANPAVRLDGGPDPKLEKLARRTFLASEVSSGIDLLFGGGSTDFVTQAAAGRLVDSGIVRAHPEIFASPAASAHEATSPASAPSASAPSSASAPEARSPSSAPSARASTRASAAPTQATRPVPLSLGGEPYWDEQGRWVGVCLSGFGICYNPDALARRGISSAPQSFEQLSRPEFFGQIALADPTKSASAVRSFEMIIQEQMNLRSDELLAAHEPSAEERAPREGWDRAMRLLRRLSANARYFTDAASKIPMDVSMGNALAGTCIDFYGRVETPGAGSRLRFVAPPGSTSMGADTIGLLRGAPHRELAQAFLEFAISPEGQKVWGFKVGTEGGPVRYALHRLPILPALYDDAYTSLRSDPEENPYREAPRFVYHAAWTAPLFRVISFVVRAMCVDTQDELASAYRALFEHGFPPRAAALFDDVSAVDYQVAKNVIQKALSAPGATTEAELGSRLIEGFRAQYVEVRRLANEGS